MAWQVYYGDTLIGDPRLELPMVDKELEVSLNQTGRFEFTLLLGHPMLGKLELYQKLHEVRVVQDGEEVFRGRVMEAEESFDKSIRYTCEGDRGYLNDALLPSYEVGVDTPSTYAGFFNWVISKYNDSMQENARFSVGLNQAEELGEMPAKKSEGHPKAWEELKSTVVEAGGYVRTRHEAYARVIDLLVEGDKTSSQRIRFGENLLDYSRRTGGADYCTRCCATGGTPSKGQATSTSGAGDQAKVAWLDQDAEGTADWSLYKGVAVTVKFEHGNSHANPTLSVQNTGAYPVTDWDGSSPDGKDWAENETRSFWFDGSHWVMDYDSSKNSEQVTLQVLADRGLLNGYRLEDGWVVNFEAEQKYGVIEGIYENSDQMFPEQLLQEALRWLVNVKVGNTIEMTALDLHNVDPDVSPIRVGDYVRATSRPHGFDEYFICTSRKYDLDHPENDEFTLGSEYDTLTASQSRRLAELNAGINSAVDQVDIATALAGSKSAIFSEQPAVYKANDLWVQAPADESGTFNIMVATADSDGTFKASDWERASDYTNDAAVLRLQAVYAQYVEAAEGRFDNLETNSLTAESATIKNLEADTAKVHDLTADNLSAATGYIADLKSKNITTDNINAATGYIGSLTSNDITVQKLTADSAYIDALTANDVTASDLTATNAYIEDLKADNVSAQNLSAASGYIATLTSNDVTAQNLTADHGYIGTLTSNNITASDIVSDHAEIGSLDSNYAHITEGVIDNATIGHADVDGLNANYAHITSGSIDNATIDQAKVNNLSSNYAHITNGVIDNATIGYADVDNLSAHYAEITNGKINSALIDTAAIVDEQVFTVTGNKATISEINADTITVRNLHTSNLTVDTADGYVTIGNKKTPTKEYIDSLKDELQQEIDGAVETWTSTAVPLMSNYPTTQWALDPDDYDTQAEYEEAQRKAYAKHVGDICYVQQQGSDYDGFCYRFSYSNGDFSWVLIKDSSVTKALGEISELQTFESETTSWIDETEEGLTTIRNNHTALSGVVDKTVKSSTQLWYTKANTTAPTKPTAKVTSTATTGNGWRTVVPAWNASYPNYYYCWQFELADGTYAWSDVVRDIAMGESQGTSRDAQATADANIKSSVQLWFTKANSTAPAKPTSQVTTNNPATGNAWNLAVPTYSSSYPHYFYCYQQQKGDGTYQWSDVVYDKGTTEAMQKAQAALPATTYDTFVQNTFKELVDTVDEQSSTITTMGERISTTARNLLNATVSPKAGAVRSVRGTGEEFRAEGKWYTYNAESTLSRTEDGIRVDHAGGANGGIVIPLIADGILADGEKLTLSFDYRTNYTALGALYVLCDPKPNASQGTPDTLDASGEWKHYEYTWTYKANANVPWAILISYYNSAGKYLEIRDGSMILERGAMTVTTLTSTVNSVQQKADANTASIGGLSTVVSNNGLTSSTNITSRASKIEQTLDGFSSTVGAIVDETVTGTNILTGNALNPYNWTISAPTGASYTKTAYGTAGVKVQFSTVSGYERLYSPAITVVSGKKYTLSVEYTVGKDYVITAGKGGFGLSVYKAAPTDTFDSSNANFVARAQFFETATRVAMKATVTFTASSNTVYLGLNGGQINDGQTGLEFTLDKLTLVENISSRMSSAETTISQTANNVLIKATESDTTAAQGGQHLIQSLINVAPSGVTISADKVNIAGAAIFTSGRLSENSLNNAYDSKGSAAAVQTNLDNLEIGGRNYVLNSEGLLASGLGSASGSRKEYQAVNLGQSYMGVEAGTKVTVSFDLYMTVNTANPYIQVYNTNNKGPKAFSSSETGTGSSGGPVVNFIAAVGSVIDERVSVTGYINDRTSPTNADNWLEFYSNYGTSNWFSISNLKLEKGEKATDWAPAPEDHTAYVDNLKIGGTNLLRHTDTLEDTGWWTHYKTTSVAAGKADPDGGTGAVLVTPETTAWYLSAKKENALLKDVGEEYTASVWLRADTQTTCKICVRYLQSDYADGTSATATTRMTVTVPTTWTKFSVTGTLTTAQTADSFWVGQSTTVPMYVYHPKVEKGVKATDWSASPEDIVAKSQRIYYRTSATTKPTAPTTWVTEKGDKRAANATTATNWTTKVTSIASGTGASVEKYLYLYTCVQTVSGTGVLTNSEVLLDDTTTVIDGGKIITGSVTANQIDVGSIAIGNLSGGSAVVSNATDGNTAYNRHTAYRGTCSTAAETAAKVAACTGFALASGATVECYCSTANTANVPTLNVNSTGAKPIWINGAVASASNPCKWKAGDTVTFTYNTVDVSTGVFRASLPVENYITADSSGIKIHDAANTTNYQHQTSSGTDIYVSGKKRSSTNANGMQLFAEDGEAETAYFGADAVRLGKYLGEVGSESIQFFSHDDTACLEFETTLRQSPTGTGVNPTTVISAEGWLYLRSDYGEITLPGNHAGISETSAVRLLSNNGSGKGNGLTVFQDGHSVFSGNLELQGNTIHHKSIRIALGGTSVERDAIAFKAGNADGDAVVIGAGGQTIVGSGESAANLYSALNTPTEEALRLASDGGIYFHPNANTIANRRTWELNAHLYRRHETIDSTSDTNGITSNQNTYLALLDKNGKYVSWINLQANTAGSSITQIYARHVVDGSNVDNALSIGVTKDGTRTVSVSDAGVWRTALGAAASSHNHAASNITAGTLGVARGGTGAASFAADSLLMTGTTATGAFRALSPDDYGPLYYSDDEEFVFGTLPVGYGGTGKSGGAFHSCTQLYNSTSGSNGTITLSSSVANYDYLAIWTVDNNGANPQISWVATRKANTTSTVLHVEVSANTTTYFRRARYAISGTSMTPSLGNYIQNQAPATWTSGTAGTNYVKVTRVMGYVI